MRTLWRDSGCDLVRDRLLDGLEGRLSLAARLEAEAHLGRCPRCADELADLAAVRVRVRRALGAYRLAHARVSPGRARLAARIDRPSGLRRVFAAFSRVGRPAEAVLALAVLGSVFFVGGIGLVEQHVSEIDRPRVVDANRPLDRDDPAWLVRFRYRPSPAAWRSDMLTPEVVPATRDDGFDRANRAGQPRPTAE